MFIYPSLGPRHSLTARKHLFLESYLRGAMISVVFAKFRPLTPRKFLGLFGTPRMSLPPLKFKAK